MSFLLALVIDESGSMQPRAAAVVEAVNALVDGYRDQEGALVRLTSFAGHLAIHHRRVTPAKEAPRLAGPGEPILKTSFRYAPSGSTALLDAVSQTIDGIEVETKKERPERTLVAIMTDGQENDSRKTDLPTLRDRIERLRATGAMEFVFLGADIDAFLSAGGMGIPATNTAIYQGTAMGQARAVNVLASSSQQYFNSGDIVGLGRAIPEKERP